LQSQSLCNILSNERIGLFFTIAPGPRQRSHSRVGVSRDPWPYFTVSNSRLSQPGDSRSNKVEVTLRLTISQSVSQSVLVSSPILGSWPGIYYCLTVTVLLLWGALPDEKTGLCFVRVIVCSGKSFVIM
jgi:hypothetical protein